jgi:hypothetical protein
MAKMAMDPFDVLSVACGWRKWQWTPSMYFRCGWMALPAAVETLSAKGNFEKHDLADMIV